MRKTIDGNTACASVAYQLSEVATIYPITPSSTMSELADKWSSDGVHNLFSSTVDVVQMQSEAGAAGAMHGALSGGALATTFTSSQGLLLMIPNMYKIAGELLPNVIHVSSRSLATHALNIFGDHSDVMATRQTGYALLCSSSVQEAQDFALVAHIATLKTSVPFVHFFDGFRTSHEINTIEAIDPKQIASIYPYDELKKFKARSLNSSHPHQQGTSQNPDIFFQNREAANKFYNNTPSIVSSVFAEVSKLTGRNYRLFDYYGSANPTHLVVLMGSAATTTRSTVDFLNLQGYNYGLITVRLYRPFSVQDFVNAIPSTVTKITVLDKTKEAGSIGEPLYQDVVNALYESGKTNIAVFGGRYGLGNKEFTPTMVKAVYDNMDLKTPKNHFTIGIEDDVTHTNLPLGNPLITCENRMVSCKFYGFGGDGTVSASRSSVQMIAENSPLFAQAYFEYDSKKSGNATITHMRYGKNPIEECYLLNNIAFVGCHNQSYVTKFNLLKDVKVGGTFLLNTNYTLEQLEKVMPNRLKQNIASKKINFYTIDAYGLALKNGLNDKINLIMQTAFFYLTNILPFDLAKQKVKDYAKTTYAKSGEEFLQKNYQAIDQTVEQLQKVDYPTSWSKLSENDGTSLTSNNVTETDYFKNFIQPIQRLEGDSLPVSSFDPRGFVPTGTSKLEKRGIANQLPCWVSENCIQCNLCSFVCPHAAIRSHLVKPENLTNTPDGFTTLTAIGESEKQFKVQLSPLDCTGCGVCAQVCPVKNKALVMQPTLTIMEQEKENYNYLLTVPKEQSIFHKGTVKGLGFVEPYFEFSGACAGCGETPYLKVLTQLFGDRMIMANATGCSSIYGGTAPANPYTTDKNGNGVAWANSLFEDNAEFGLGIKLGANQKQNRLKQLLNSLLTENLNPKLNEFITSYLNTNKPEEQRYFGKAITEIITLRNNIEPKTIFADVLTLSDAFVNQSVWIVGGDGWAYDIGYGGLDHVFNSGENINILVLDTEVYSNTGGQASKATPLGASAKFASKGKRSRKKDLALLATLNKDVYVAKVSMGSNPNQLLKTLQEAESYNGVSLIIAYAPCIAHGIDMSKSQEHMKLAVQTGYWHLWHYNPSLRQEGKNPFVLDSQKPTKPIREFLEQENRFKVIAKKQPEVANQLFEQAQTDADELYNFYKKCNDETIL